MTFNIGDKVVIKTDLHPVPAGTEAIVIDNTLPLFGYRVEFLGEWVPTISPEEEPEAWEEFDNTCPVFGQEIELVEAAPVVEEVQEELAKADIEPAEESIEDVLALAAGDAHDLAHIIAYVGQLVMGYETMRVLCIENGSEMGESIYELVRNEAHTTFHLLLDYKASISDDDEEDTDDGTHEDH